MPLTKQGAFTFNHSDQPNDLYNVETSTQIKSNFDSRAQEVANTMNAIIDQLKAITDTDSGADNIGATAITGLTGTTVQTVLEALKTQIDNVTLGQIPDNSITKQKLAFNAADQNILSSTTTSEGASLIGIEDASAHFTSTNVEGALSELFQFANDGKTNIATVVGSPATTSDTFSQLQTHIQDAKNSMATNLTNKGQTSTGTEALQALADKIANVSTGKKYASGTVTSGTTTSTAKVVSDGTTGTSTPFYLATVNGLTFKPNYIIVYGQESASYEDATIYVNDSRLQYVAERMFVGQYNVSAISTVNSYATRASSPFTVTSTSFTVPVMKSSTQYYWVAYE